MALINTQPVRVDDLDKTPDATAHVVIIDGEEFHVDLGDINYKLMRAAVDPYLSAGVKVGKGKPKGKRTVSAEEKAQDKAIRAWSAAQGTPLKPSGRIPRAARLAWEAAQPTAGEASAS
mgnify:FL=1